MAFPAGFDEENGVLGPPADGSAPGCESLSVFRGQDANGELVTISCWKLTKEELEEINRTGRVWLLIYGHGMPPACLSGQKPFS